MTVDLLQQRARIHHRTVQLNPTTLPMWEVHHLFQGRGLITCPRKEEAETGHDSAEFTPAIIRRQSGFEGICGWVGGVAGKWTGDV
jgi:hypothetical protein